jgi:hypothetical protein
MQTSRLPPNNDSVDWATDVQQGVYTSRLPPITMRLDPKINNRYFGKVNGPSNDELKKFDKCINMCVRMKIKHGESQSNYKRRYFDCQLKFWENSKRYTQLQIVEYRYRKKNLLKYFKLWNY